MVLLRNKKKAVLHLLFLYGGQGYEKNADQIRFAQCSNPFKQNMTVYLERASEYN